MKQSGVLILATLLSSAMTAQSIYDNNFKVNDIEGKEFSLNAYKGKKLMIVNVASKCGLTPQYKELQALYEKYQKSHNFEIIAFPANNFLNQEPGTNEEIKAFCEKNYGVTFKIMEKISVNGSDIHPLYQWLTDKTKNGVTDEKIQWNFQKYLINPDGTIAMVIMPRENPMSDKIIRWIEK
ncbi:MAG: glutathione peroxidase [Bacteroidales bacterium]|nr:glutathione peroxidase [Bacteroidales bacterium]